MIYLSSLDESIVNPSVILEQYAIARVCLSAGLAVKGVLFELRDGSRRGCLLSGSGEKLPIDEISDDYILWQDVEHPLGYIKRVSGHCCCPGYDHDASSQFLCYSIQLDFASGQTMRVQGRNAHWKGEEFSTATTRFAPYYCLNEIVLEDGMCLGYKGAMTAGEIPLDDVLTGVNEDIRKTLMKQREQPEEQQQEDEFESSESEQETSQFFRNSPAPPPPLRRRRRSSASQVKPPPSQRVNHFVGESYRYNHHIPNITAEAMEQSAAPSKDRLSSWETESIQANIPWIPEPLQVRIRPPPTNINKCMMKAICLADRMYQINGAVVQFHDDHLEGPFVLASSAGSLPLSSLTSSSKTSNSNKKSTKLDLKQHYRERSDYYHKIHQPGGYLVKIAGYQQKQSTLSNNTTPSGLYGNNSSAGSSLLLQDPSFHSLRLEFASGQVIETRPSNTQWQGDFFSYTIPNVDNFYVNKFYFCKGRLLGVAGIQTSWHLVIRGNEFQSSAEQSTCCGCLGGGGGGGGGG
ncbi:expressed unknown protein [Seminavis robusta]|uniref:Uncharacterized protein n=1 Tax=Seminavis robusta TaxID=568900 RepID=A0A9N8DPT7_9STRA|nr:expressed unknown protein [Seminavis robusta]|eukprot:Sro204_g085780.1 n/a (520) ;mRNA; f:14097-15656